MTPKPKLKSNPLRLGIHKVNACYSHYTIAGGWLITHYEVNITVESSMITGIWTEEKEEKIPFSLKLRKDYEVEEALQGKASFFGSNLLTSYPETWAKLTPGSSWWVQSDRDMIKNPQLKEHILQLWSEVSSSSCDPETLYDAYKTGGQYDRKGKLVGLSWTSWSDIDRYKDSIRRYNCSKPEGTDGWR